MFKSTAFSLTECVILPLFVYLMLYAGLPTSPVDVIVSASSVCDTVQYIYHRAQLHALALAVLLRQTRLHTTYTWIKWG